MNIAFKNIHLAVAFLFLATAAASSALELSFTKSDTGATVLVTITEDGLGLKVHEPGIQQTQYLNSVGKGSPEFEYRLERDGIIKNRSIRSARGLIVEARGANKSQDFAVNDLVFLQEVVFYQCRSFMPKGKQVLPMVYQDFERTDLAFEPIADRTIQTPAGAIDCRGVRMRLEGFASLFAYIRWDFWYSKDERNLPVLAEEFANDKMVKSTFILTRVQ